MQAHAIQMNGRPAVVSVLVDDTQSRLMLQKLKPQARLSEAQAIAIFQSRASNQSAAKVAKSYGVNEKTVRDIWTCRTWAKETWHLDPSRRVEIKRMGRPIGCRDTKPRKQKGCKLLPRTASKASDIEQLLSVKSLQTFHQPLTTEEAVVNSERPCSQLREWWLIKSIDDQLYEWEQKGSWILSMSRKA